jgi:hypothetical protein
MKSLSKRLTGVLLSATGVLAVVLALASGIKIHAENHSKKTPLGTDWSHHHLVYSALRNTANAEKVEREPRYQQQLLRRGHDGRGEGWRNPFRNDKRHQMGRDWSMLMGAGATLGAGNYPAKFAFDLNAEECGTDPTPDYVAFNTNLDGANAAAATGSVTVNPSLPIAGNTLTVGSITYTFQNGLATCGLTPCIIRSSQSIDAARIIAAVNDSACNSAGDFCFNIPGANPVATASANGLTSVTLTATAIGAAGDFAVATNNTGALGVSGGNNGTDAAATVVAYDNLYSGCPSGPVPTTYWAYNTSGTANASVTVSGDGSQIAFVQLDNVTGIADLVLLKWAPGEGSTYNGTTTSPATPDASTTTGSVYVSCKSGSGSCMMTIPFSNSKTDSNSSPFYDYINDILYVGDDAGVMHKFTGVFQGTPAEVTTAPWPVTVNSSGLDALTSPIYDSVSGLVFVADARGGSADTFGGRVYSIDPTAGTVTMSHQLAGGAGFNEGPLVDGTAGAVYAFAPVDTGGTNAGVFEMGTSSIGSGISLEATVGTGSSSTALYGGDFDNDYYTFTGSGPGGTDHMYVCGNPGGVPTLYQIEIDSYILNPATVVTGPALASTAGPCSPVTEIYNPNATGGAADWIFASVTTGALTSVSSGCTAGAGCLMSFTLDDATPFTIPSTATAGLPSAGGASGVIVDNVVGSGTITGASQVYFTPLSNQACTTSGGTGGCAIQASQSGLQ